MENSPLDFKKVLASGHSEVIEVLNLAARDMADRKIDHWSIWLSPSKEKILEINRACNDGEFYFVYKNDIRVGMFRLLDEDLPYWGVQNDKAWYIHSLVTLPEYRGQEIGKVILRQIEEWAINSEIRILRLDCNSKNDYLNTYYPSLGYKYISKKQMPHSLNNLYQKDLL